MSPDDPRHGTTAGHSAGCRDLCCRHHRGADYDADHLGVSEVCRRLHITQPALQKWCGNHGLHDLYRRLSNREDGFDNDTKRRVA